MQPPDRSLMVDVLAPAKLNLGLHVLRKRADGYHDLDTVFLKIGWADRIRIAPAGDLAFSSSDPDLPTDSGNLCVRAAQLLTKEAGARAGAEIYLDKHIPYGAGLGGGSSDAALTLKVLNEIWATGLSRTRLLELGAQLGSDVPFFLLDTPAARGTGRGEVLEPLEGFRLPFSVVVIVPPVQVSTALAYRLVRPNDTHRPHLVRAVLSTDLDVWNREVRNDFQTPIFEAFPAVAEAHRFLVDTGAGYAAMSGSGSAVFGLFEDAGRAARAAQAASAFGYRCWTDAQS